MQYRRLMDNERVEMLRVVKTSKLEQLLLLLGIFVVIAVVGVGSILQYFQDDTIVSLHRGYGLCAVSLIFSIYTIYQTIKIFNKLDELFASSDLMYRDCKLEKKQGEFWVTNIGLKCRETRVYVKEPHEDKTVCLVDLEENIEKEVSATRYIFNFIYK